MKISKGTNYSIFFGLFRRILKANKGLVSIVRHIEQERTEIFSRNRGGSGRVLSYDVLGVAPDAEEFFKKFARTHLEIAGLKKISNIDIIFEIF